jgi:hypothetical protein
MDTGEFARAVEAYLCRRNGGHLIRIVGPAFELVEGWRTQGIPLKVVCQGIDRTVARREAGRGRRRPVRIEFCEADVHDAFDDWRRAVGPYIARQEETAGDDASQEMPSTDVLPRGPSLPQHLQRVLVRLTALQLSAGERPALTSAIAGAAGELDRMLSSARSARGDTRERLLGRLAELDREIADAARVALSADEAAGLEREADEILAPHRLRMPPDELAKAREGALRQLARSRFTLPRIAFP